MKHQWVRCQPDEGFRAEICEVCHVARERFLFEGIWKSFYQLKPDDEFRRFERAPKCKTKHEGIAA